MVHLLFSHEKSSRNNNIKQVQAKVIYIYLHCLGKEYNLWSDYMGKKCEQKVGGDTLGPQKG